MKRIIIMTLTMLLLAAIIFNGCAEPTPAPAPAPAPAPTTPSGEVRILKGIVNTPLNDKKTIAQTFPYVDALNERLKGEIEIEVVGGNDIVPTFEQAPSVQSGLFDICLSSARGYLGNVVPTALASDCSQFDAAGERALGAYDIWVESFKEAGLRYLGMHDNGDASHYYVWTNKKISSLAELKGQSLRIFGAHRAVASALGASAMAMPLGDVYTALQRGVVDGVITNPDACDTFHLYEVLDYVVEPGYGQLGSIIYMNIDTWNSLPNHVQQVFIEETIAAEARDKISLAEATQRGWDNIDGSGMEHIQLSQADGDRLVSLALDALWGEAEKSDSSGWVEKIRPFLTK